MNHGPLEELQFTEEEIDHAVHVLGQLQYEQDGAISADASHVRAVLRAVRAVPARCLNGGLAGHPAAVGMNVQGVGLGGVQLRGQVVVSYPVTTTIRTPGNGVEYIWTNTISSWDPSTDELAVQMARLQTVLDSSAPPDHVVFVGPHGHSMDLVADDDGMAVEADR